MPEGLSATEVGAEIAEHGTHHAGLVGRNDRALSIAEAILLSLVTIVAALSSYGRTMAERVQLRLFSASGMGPIRSINAIPPRRRSS